MGQCGSPVFSVPFGNSLVSEAAQPACNKYGMESRFLGTPMGMMYSRAVDPVVTYLAVLRLCCTAPRNNLQESLHMFFPVSLLTDISKSCPTLLLQDLYRVAKKSVCMLSWQRGLEQRPGIRSCLILKHCVTQQILQVSALVSCPFSMGAVI